MNTADLVTLTRVRKALNLADSDTSDNALLSATIRQASAFMQAFARRAFHPHVAAHTFDYDGIAKFAGALETPDLLEVTALVNGDGATIASTEYVLSPRNIYPKWRLELRRTSAVTFVESAAGPEGAITIAGIWGYHEQYPTCWASASTLASAISTTSATSVSVVSGAAYELGQYVMCDSEQMRVTAIVTNTLTVERGVNGTTAATHSNGAALKVYAPMPDIEAAALALTIWLYRNRDVASERIQFLDGSQIITNEAPQNIRMTLQQYVRGGVYAI